MKARFARFAVGVISGGALLAAVACSEFKPGAYEQGGRSGGPIIIGGAGSGCSSIGTECQSADECCSHLCQFTGQVLTCAPSADSGPTCTADNAACNLNTDCCSAYCSPGKLCGTAPLQDSGGGG